MIIIISGGTKLFTLTLLSLIAYAVPPVNETVNGVWDSVSHLGDVYSQERLKQLDWLDNGQLNLPDEWTTFLSDGTQVNCNPQVAAASIGNLPTGLWDEAHTACGDMIREIQSPGERRTGWWDNIP